MIQLDGHSLKAKVRKNAVVQLDKLKFLNQAGGTHHIRITLIKFPESASLGTVCPPDGLYLIPFKWE